MKTNSVNTKEQNFTCKQFIGSLSFIEEDWMKQRRMELSNETKPERLKNEKYEEFPNTVNYEINQLNT